jgi:hypothetical protein
MVRYKMVGRDINSNPTQYRTWIVPNTPDLTGQFYTGPKSGRNPLVDITAYAIDDDAVIADFNFPKATTWQPHPSELVRDFPIRKVTPGPVEDSHSLVLDGYIYLFGGKVTATIYRATISNPADFVDTGARLPTPLYGAALAIVGNRIYLFGGNDGSGNNMGLGSVDTIFSAPVSNPLSWTNHGSLLPRKVHYSNLGMYGGNLYLFGGREINVATDRIVTASTTNPLLWTDTGFKIPTPTYGSILAQINGNWIMYGGLLFPDTPTNVIWSAPVTSPTTWSFDGYLLYPTAFGQFFTIGNDGYLIGPMVEPPHTTTINHLSSGFILPDGYSNPSNSIYVASIAGFPSVGSLIINDTAGADVVNYTGITRNPDPTKFGPGDGYSFDNITGGIGHLSTGDTVTFLPNGFTPILQCSLSQPNIFLDTLAYVRGVISHSNLALVYDKVWLYGGSGETAIFACHQQLKYNYYNPLVEAYAETTRVTVPATDNINNPYQALGVPYWKTDYPINFTSIVDTLWISDGSTIYTVDPNGLQVLKNLTTISTGIYSIIYLNGYIWALAATGIAIHDPAYGTGPGSGLNESMIVQIDPSTGTHLSSINLNTQATFMSTDGNRYLNIGCYNDQPSFNPLIVYDTVTNTFATHGITLPAFLVPVSPYPAPQQLTGASCYDPVSNAIFIVAPIMSSPFSFAKVYNNYTSFLANQALASILDANSPQYSIVAGNGSIWTIASNGVNSPFPTKVFRWDPNTLTLQANILISDFSTDNGTDPITFNINYNSQLNLIIVVVGYDPFSSTSYPVTVYMIDANTNTVVGQVALDPTTAGAAPNTYGVATYGDKIWVVLTDSASLGSGIHEIDIPSKRVKTNATFGPGVAITFKPLP